MTAVQMTSTISVDVVRVLADDYHVTEAARVSTLGSREQSSSGHRGLIRALMRDHHGSPFEHNLFTFRVHAPLYVMTEHLRHRAGWSYNGESGRFKTFEPIFYTPPPERGLTQVGRAMDYDIQPGNEDQRRNVAASLEAIAEEAWEEYLYLLEYGIAREVARQVLPTNLMTSYFTTCNARSLMAFLALRTTSEDSKPLWEIEQVAKGYEAALAAAMPITHEAFNDFGRKAP